MSSKSLSDYEIFVEAGTIGNRLAQLSAKYLDSFRCFYTPMITQQFMRKAGPEMVDKFRQRGHGPNEEEISSIIEKNPSILDMFDELMKLDRLLRLVLEVPHVTQIPLPAPDPRFPMYLSVACELMEKEGKRKLFYDLLPYELERAIVDKAASNEFKASLTFGISDQMTWMHGISFKPILSFARSLQSQAGTYWSSAAALDFKPSDAAQAREVQATRAVFGLRASAVDMEGANMLPEDLRRVVTEGYGKMKLESSDPSRIVTGSEVSVDFVLPDEDGNFPFQMPE